MNRFFIILFLFFGFTTSQAQIYEVGVFLGGTNYIGDIGPTNYISPNEFAYGVIFKWNKSTRHAWRFSYIQSKITSNDLDSDMASRIERGYNFENQIKEFSAGIEFNFFDFNLHTPTFKYSPYVYLGLSYAQYEGLFFLDDEVKVDNNRGLLAIPIAVGIKAQLMDKLILGFEIGPRPTFKDDIDGSNSSNENLVPLQFGNINNNDWYVFTGFTLTYTFGKNPCYCKD